MNEPTLVKAGHLPELSRVSISLFDRDDMVGKTGRALYHLLYSLAGTRKQPFAGAAVFAKLLRVERQAVHRGIKELTTAQLLTVHEKGNHVSVVVPESFSQESLVLFSVITGDTPIQTVDVPVALPAPVAPAPTPATPEKKQRGRPRKNPEPAAIPAAPPPAPTPQPVAQPTVPVATQAPAAIQPVVPPPPQAPITSPAVESTPTPEEPEQKVKMNEEIASWCCANLENMTAYLCFGAGAWNKPDTSTLRPSTINWRIALRSDGTADPERWTPNQFMGFYWYRVSRYRAYAGLPLTLPGKDFGRVAKDISNLLIKLGGKVATYNFIDTLTAYFDLVKYQIGGTFGASQALDETTLSKAQIVGAVHAVQQMDMATRTQLLQQVSQTA